ncbi:MAG: LapA family protein [Nitrospiraceae bacterium]|nr:MAG: LapA family protein [Nitrospiraceae bacterium]
MKVFLLIVLIVAGALGIVAFQNNTEVTVQFIKWTLTGHMAVVLSVPFAVGLLAGISMLLPSLWRKASQARYLKKRVKELEEEPPKQEEAAPEELPPEEEGGTFEEGPKEEPGRTDQDRP